MQRKEVIKENLDFRASLKILVPLMVASVLLYLFQGHFHIYTLAFSAILTSLFAIGGFTVALLASRRFGFGREGRLALVVSLFSIGMGAAVLGEIIRSAYYFEMNGEILYSRVGDFLIVSCYGLLFAGLLIYLITYVRTLAAVLVTSALCVVCLIGPVLLLDVNLFSKFFDILFPIFDIVFLGLAVLGCAASNGARLATAWRVIFAAIIIEIVAAVIMDYQAHNGGYQPGNLVDMLYVVGYWLLTMAFLAYMREP